MHIARSTLEGLIMPTDKYIKWLNSHYNGECTFEELVQQVRAFQRVKAVGVGHRCCRISNPLHACMHQEADEDWGSVKMTMSGSPLQAPVTSDFSEADDRHVDGLCPSALRSARLPVSLIGSPITSRSTALSPLTSSLFRSEASN